LAVVTPGPTIADFGERVITAPSAAGIMHGVDAECVVAQDVGRCGVTHEAGASRHALAAVLVAPRGGPPSPRLPVLARSLERRRHAEGVPADRRRRPR